MLRVDAGAANGFSLRKLSARIAIAAAPMHLCRAISLTVEIWFMSPANSLLSPFD